MMTEEQKITRKKKRNSWKTNKTFNKVVVTISSVHKDPARPWVDQYTVTIENTVDNARDYHNNNSDDIPGYYEKEDREDVLRQSRHYLHDVFMKNLKHVSVKMEEE